MNKFHVKRQTKRQWYRLIVTEKNFKGYVVAPNIGWAKDYSKEVFKTLNIIVVDTHSGAMDSPCGLYNENYELIIDMSLNKVNSKKLKTQKSGSFVDEHGDWKWRNEDGSVQELW